MSTRAFALETAERPARLCVAPLLSALLWKLEVPGLSARDVQRADTTQLRAGPQGRPGWLPGRTARWTASSIEIDSYLGLLSLPISLPVAD